MRMYFVPAAIIFALLFVVVVTFPWGLKKEPMVEKPEKPKFSRTLDGSPQLEMEGVKLPPPPPLFVSTKIEEPAEPRGLQPKTTRTKYTKGKIITPLAREQKTEEHLVNRIPLEPLQEKNSILASKRYATNITALKPSLILSQEPLEHEQSISVSEREDSNGSDPIETPGQVIRPDKSDGRPLLRMIEHGIGPQVEIVWPESGLGRSHLFKLFQGCYGMKIALLDGQNNLFTDKSTSGAPWAINRDKYSQFSRSSDGVVIGEEYKIATRIRAIHGIRSARIMRIFPRGVDAILLAGIKGLLGEKYDKTRVIRAKYEVWDQKVVVSNITSDGKTVRGTVDLSTAAKKSCVV